MPDLRADRVDSSDALRFLTVRVSERHYALRAEDVAEIVRVPAMARVPQSPRALLGIANLRGSVVPVVSLRGLLGLAEDSAGPGGRAVPRDLLERLNEAATGGLRPDRTYLLDVDVATGVARAGGRAGQKRDRIESEDTEFFESVRRRYLELAAEDPERIVLLRGTDSREDLARQMLVDALTLLRSRDIQPSRTST